MNKRTAHVKRIRVNSIAYSSIFDIGDVKVATPISHAIAVQRQGGVKSDTGFDFGQFDIFAREANTLPDNETVRQEHIHHNRHIYVNNVNVTGITASSFVQIGSLRHLEAESRIKHIRITEEGTK
ncbi:spore germination protein GerPE [Aquibacillus koreensis]|uniref:Spore germination protein GerPE n=1 Tax=Aquibacillus koreensis TaxID=279446 RepID=A0A9X3WK51_9BACI|nr:spore germination protein GerPE [Aquibacillus koreensis]MCT2535607.1 spore germination protein GerPE [Aquibacillus koreensis]MDC3420108.1 spore germination protein GerPE [Aquibacillus koreensis]